MKRMYTNIPLMKTVSEFQNHIDLLDVQIPIDSEVVPAPSGALAQPYLLRDGKKIGNRFCIQPMEGWDGTTDGRPTDLVFRRWKNFGRSGAKLIWGGESMAVRPDGRANPNQLMILNQTMQDIEALRLALVNEHKDHFGQVDDLLVGLQLTHSGRFC
ncbi:unnamed protein product, partial [marine sediment metagenome]